MKIDRCPIQGGMTDNINIFTKGFLFVFLVIFLTGCGQQQDQKTDSLTINSVVFTRTGLFVKMSEPVTIKQVNISRNGQNIVSQSFNAVKEVLIDLDWARNSKYDMEVVTDKQTVKMPVYSSDKPSPVKIAEILLEDLEQGEMQYRYYASRGAKVCFSPDGKMVGVGSKGGYIYVIDIESKQIVWKHKIPEGRVAKVAFTSDGRLYAGEESKDGYFYCFDARSGKLLWKYKTFDDFEDRGSQVTNMRGDFKYWPLVIWGLAVDRENNPYFMVRNNFEREIKGKKIRDINSMVCKFDGKTGKPVWKFPIATSAWGLRISEDGKYVIPIIGWAEEATLSVLDSSSGKPFWQYTFTCKDSKIDSFRGRTGFHAEISPDGKYVVVNQVYPDVTYVFNNQESVKNGQAKLLWKKDFLKVLEVGGVPISVSSINLKLTESELIFATWGTRALGRGDNNAQIPSQHPDADTLFVYNYDGKLKWKWKMGEGTWNDECILSKNQKFMILPIGTVPESPYANPYDMGIYVFNPKAEGGATAKMCWFYNIEGFAYKSDISADGKYIVVLEGPFDIDPDRIKENIVGKHRLIILS